MIRLLRNTIAVRPLPIPPESLQVPSVIAANAEGGTDKTAESVGTTAPEPAPLDAAVAEGAKAANVATAVETPVVSPKGVTKETAEKVEASIERMKRPTVQFFEVVGVGPGRRAESYSSWPQPIVPLDVSVGDTVILNRGVFMVGQAVIADDGKEAFLIDDREILAVIDKDPETKGDKKAFADPKGK